MLQGLLFILMLGFVVLLLFMGIVMRFFSSLFRPFRNIRERKQDSPLNNTSEFRRKRFNKHAAEEVSYEEIKDK